jgi:tRNA pseudouridine55 synthase
MSAGIVLLDKPRGLSSNAALQKVRRLFGRIKAGHVGSLDPLATGMLPVCLGEATKIAGEIISARKCYRFSVALGTRTDSGDAEGAPCGEAKVPALDGAQVSHVLAGFVGVREQVPPMYSALKYQGEPLYRLARAGHTVQRAPRRIELLQLTLVQLEAQALTLEVVCSKGTYVRVLAEEIAQALGTLGHVSTLRRLYVEPFAGEPMHSLAALEESAAAGTLPALLPPDWPLALLPAVELTRAEAQRLLHGQRVPCASAGPAQRVRLYEEGGRFLGLGETDGDGGVQPRRLLQAHAGG